MTQPNRVPAKDRIRIRLDGMDAYVQRRHRCMVEPMLTETRIRFENGANGILARHDILSLARPADKRAPEKGGLRFAAKLWRVMLRELTDCGYQTELQVPRWQRLMPPVEPTLIPANEALNQVLRTPGSRCGALIRFGRHGHPFDLVPRILRAYPHSRVALAVPTDDQVWGWLQELRGADLARPVLTPEQWWGNRHAKVVVSNMEKLDWCRTEDFDLAIVPDARVLLGIDARPIDYEDPHPPRDYRLLRHWHIPAFGFVPAAVDLKPGEERRLWSLFACTAAIG